MNTANHRAITEQALGTRVSPAALEAISAANIGQDALRYQIGHDHFHFDNNAFAAGNRYVDEQRRLATSLLERGLAPAARAAFGRLTHAAQDFYAHSNYVSLWLAAGGAEDARAIDPLDPALLQHPGLRSGKIYLPLEALTYFPALVPHVAPYLPQDSHTHMNKDNPARPHFELAFGAAVKRTQHEFDLIASALAPQALALFTDLH
jgi:hypothetical protein